MNDNHVMSEATDQIEVVRWCDLHGVPVYHVPNEAKRKPTSGAYLRRMGMKAGVPDLCIPVARNGYHGLYIEMKYGKGKVTENQLKWLKRLRLEGYAAFVCYGSESAIECVRRYIYGTKR